MILVTGATGEVGREVVAQLAAAGEAVRALTRDPARARFPAKVERAKGDLEQPETLAAALHGVRKVYLFLGPDLGVGLLAAAQRAGVEHVVMLSSLLTLSQSTDNAIAQRHLIGEANVKESGIPWTFVQPGGFASNTLRYARTIRERSVICTPYPQVRTGLIDPEDIAAVVVAALRSPGHEGKAYPLTGPEALSVPDQARVFSEVLGREIRVEEQSVTTARAEMIEQMPAEVVDAVLSMLRLSVDRPPIVLDTVAKVIGRPPRKFADWVSRHAEVFRG